MARKNMYIKDDPTIKRPRTSPVPYGAPPSSYGGAGYSAPPPYRPQGFQAPNSAGAGDNPPCNTLFVGNLAENVNENELRGLFANCAVSAG